MRVLNKNVNFLKQGVLIKTEYEGDHHVDELCQVLQELIAFIKFRQNPQPYNKSHLCCISKLLINYANMTNRCKEL